MTTKRFPPVYARIDDEEVMKFLYGLRAETGATMAQVIKEMARFCQRAKNFKLSEESYNSKTISASMEKRKRHLAKLKQLAK